MGFVFCSEGGTPQKKKQTTVCVARAFFSRIFRAHPRFPRQNRPQFALRARCFFRAFSRSTAGVSSQVLASARAPQGRASVLLAHAPRRGGRRFSSASAATRVRVPEMGRARPRFV